jgi:hypothetical protein
MRMKVTRRHQVVLVEKTLLPRKKNLKLEEKR